MPHDVFLSYARDEAHLAEPLKRQLVALGLTVFQDVDDLEIGVSFPEPLQQELDQCQAVFAVWTRLSLRRKWCLHEIREAEAASKLVAAAPVPVGPGDVPDNLVHHNYARLHDFAGQETHLGWSQVLRQLAEILARSPAHAQKAADLRAVADAARGGAAEAALEAYRRDIRWELASTPWALHAPQVPAAGRVDELFVQVTVGRSSPRPLADVHRPDGRFVLLGDPGAGKTMALKHYGLWCLDHGLTPIFLRAGAVRAGLDETLREQPLTQAVAPLLLRSIYEGKAVLLVDSIDEVDRDNEKAAVRKALAGWAADPQWARCPIVAASRSVGYIAIPKYTELEVQPLGAAEMVELLGRWEVPQARIDEVVAQRAEGGRLETMAQNPLLVTLIAIVLREQGTRRRQWSRTGLYRDALEALLTATYRRASTDDGAYPHRELATQVLGAHALRAHGTEERDVFAPADVEDAAGPWVAQLKAASPNRRVSGFLAELAQKTGVIETRGGGMFGFPHRTFAEYLAATELARRWAAGDGAGDMARVLDAAAWDAAAEQRAWQPYFEKLERLGVAGASRWTVAEFPPSLRESWASHPQAFEFTLRPEHEATTAEVLALAHGVLVADGHGAEAAALLEAALHRRLAPQLVSRVGRALDRLDRPTAHRLFDAIPGAPHWERRRELLLDLPQLVPSPAEVQRFVEERASRVTNGGDLYWLHRAGEWLADGTWGRAGADVRAQARQWSGGFWAGHRAAERVAALAGLVWVEVGPGTFQMGSPADVGDPDEHPQHAVEVTTPFDVLDAPVTNTVYERFDPAHAEDRVGDWTEAPDDHPVYNVTWFEAAAFAQWLAAAGSTHRVRLPFEVEWELAARRAMVEPSAEVPLTELAWFQDNSEGRVHPVRQRPLAPPRTVVDRVLGRTPRPRGWRPDGPPLYDLLGNVWQWCADLWDADRYRAQAARSPHRHDPRSVQVTRPTADAVTHGAGRVVRGGCRVYPAELVRVACRSRLIPGDRYSDLGFRLVRVLAPPSRDPRP